MITIKYGLFFGCFVLGIVTSEESNCNCQDCKTILFGDFRGNWTLYESASESCENKSCLYVNENEDRKCFCDPGAVDYIQCEVDQVSALEIKALEMKVQSLNDSMQSLQATMQSFLQTMTNIHTTVNKHFNLPLNETSLTSMITLLDTLGNLTTKLEAITTKVDVNTEKTDANAAAIAGKCDASTCSAIQAVNTKLETCLGDVSSSDCPTPAPGKTGVAGINANTAAIADKCDASKCSAVETKVADVESCLADTTSTKCPTATFGKVTIPGAITALETPTVFSCYHTPAMTTSGIMAPYGACDVNVGNVLDKTTGKFTVATAGKYRLTFMSLMYPQDQKKVIAIMTKTSGGTETKLARSVAQSKIGNGQEQITTTLDIIAELAVADTIHVAITELKEDEPFELI